MLNLRFIIIIAFLFLGLNSFAQAPGYLGKRLFIEGNLGVNLGLAFGSTNTTSRNGAEADYKIFRPIGKLSISYVINRYRYISFEAEHSQFTTNQDSLFDFAGLPALKYRLTNQSIGIGFFKTNRKTTQSLAPLGFYFGYKFSLGRSFYNPIRYVDSNDKFEGVERAAYNLNYRKPVLKFLGIAISSGFRTIIKDKYTLNYAFDLGYNISLENDLFVEGDNRDFSFSISELERNNSLYVNITIGGGILLY